MFGKVKDQPDQYDELTEKYNELLSNYNELLEKHNTLTQEISKSNKHIYHQEFNIEGIDVYAIEYNPIDKKTVIGYKLVNNMKVEFHEWVFACSNRQHNNLVKRFRKKIGL